MKRWPKDNGVVRRSSKNRTLTIRGRGGCPDFLHGKDLKRPGPSTGHLDQVDESNAESDDPRDGRGHVVFANVESDEEEVVKLQENTRTHHEAEEQEEESKKRNHTWKSAILIGIWKKQKDI